VGGGKSEVKLRGVGTNKGLPANYAGIKGSVQGIKRPVEVTLETCSGSSCIGTAQATKAELEEFQSVLFLVPQD